MNFSIKSKLSNFSLLIIFFGSLIACNNNVASKEPEDLVTVSSVLTGEVFRTNREPVKNAKVYLSEKGFDCNMPILANPVKFDSTLTDANGKFAIKFSFLNIEKPICIDAFAISSNGNEFFVSDTVQFITKLKREPPYDTTRIKLSF